MQTFFDVPGEWRDDALAERWTRARAVRGLVTGALEKARAAGTIGSSLQAAPDLYLGSAQADLADLPWAELCITSGLTLLGSAPEGEGVETEGEAAVRFVPADGTKCDRCWRVLPEVGRSAAHPTLCLRCEGAVA